MRGYLDANNTVEAKIYIEGIPAIRFRPSRTDNPYPTIIFYHGWGSNKENQRLRAYILSTFGYQVIIPDAIHHGERNPIDHGNIENMECYFWDTIFNNIDESSRIIDLLIDRYDADPNRIGVVGNSMGGFTAAGVFTHNPNIGALVVFNGSCGWGHSNEFFKEAFDIRIGNGLKDVEDRVAALDPMNNMNLLEDRPILLLHGDSDSTVSIESQRIFYKEIGPLYKDRDRVQLIEYPNLNHFVTTNMMEECIHWFDTYL